METQGLTSNSHNARVVPDEDTSASYLRRRMLTFAPPRWQPLGLPPHMSPGVPHSSSRPAPTLASCLARPTTPSASLPSRPFHDPAHDKGEVQHRTRGHIRPRAVEALGASIRDNAPAAPGAFDPARGWEAEGGEATRDKVQLVLSLKAMGRRFEWRGALKVFRRAKEDGVVVDNSVYRLVSAGCWMVCTCRSLEVDLLSARPISLPVVMALSMSRYITRYLVPGNVY